ncbi:hypothetical protein CSB11_02670 [Candidatus Campbellbacteria bacterium]|nr:MAG: hypothetical protein CSB11_02670 [Candidatus Campbellbacteria bacterium]
MITNIIKTVFYLKKIKEKALQYLGVPGPIPGAANTNAELIHTLSIIQNFKKSIVKEERKKKLKTSFILVKFNIFKVDI